ncbi:MAG: hypothetical protein CVV10_03630 [Gammaproteobacteria bacterium HGW-Gammaproteobacteria-14]|nr:MAG: hypothetical protein CVV10_03630 [Gammaproteobacteria bacterium HGW-Gammaproteobacteria-14]
MTDARFNVVFAGEIVNGADQAKVRENLAAAFRMDMAKVEALFSGKRVVVKKDADQATAMKFRAVMKQAGALCDLERVGAEPVETAPAEERPAAPAKPPAAPVASAPSATTDSAPVFQSGSMETVGTIRTGGTGFSGPFEVAPAGADMAQTKDMPPPMVPDVSHLSVAPPGSDMGEKKAEKPPVNPDISHLSIDPL